MSTSKKIAQTLFKIYTNIVNEKVDEICPDYDCTGSGYICKMIVVEVFVLVNKMFEDWCNSF